MAYLLTPEDQEAERIRLENEYAAVNAAAMNTPAPKPVVKPTPKADIKADTSAVGRLKAFEIEHLGANGKEPVRINGEIERGVGSPYAKLTDEQRAQYVALEKLVEAEAALDAANAARSNAEADCKVAAIAVEAAGKKASEAEVKKEKADA